MAAGETITISITARDTAGGLIPVTPETAVIGLHTPRLTITGVSFSDSTDMVHRIDYFSSDPDGSYMVTRNWRYRIGSGAWTTISADRITGNENRPSGTYQLLWRPETALKGVYTEAMTFSMDVYDGRYTSGLSESPPFRFDWNAPPSVTISASTVDYVNERISFNFTIADAEKDSVSLAYAYSTNGGATWTAGTPDRSLVKLPQGSYSGSFGWSYLEGLQPGVDYTEFMARITPTDFKPGAPAQSAAINVDLNTPPAVLVDDLFTPQSGDVTFTYHITDPEHDPVYLACSYSTDGGTTWMETAHVSGADSITVYSGSLIWSSKEDLSSIQSFDIRFRVIPADKDDGAAAATGPFQLINNSPPSISFSLPDTVANVVRIPVMITDTEHDPVTIHAVWKSGNTDWRTATMLSNTSGIVQSAYSDSLRWDSRSDTGEAFVPGVVLKLTATDEYNRIGESSTKSASDTLVIDNEKPRISSITGYAAGDTVYVRYSEPVSTAALDVSRYSFTPSLAISNVLRNNVTNQYIIKLQNELPRTGQIVLTVSGMTDNRGNTATVLTASFAPKDDNTDPKLTIGALASELGGDVTVPYTIVDPEGDAISLSAEYSLDGGATWHTASLSGATSDIGPGGYSGACIWNSANDVPGTEHEGVFLRITPRDMQPGEAAISTPFLLDNNLPPSVTLTVPDPDGVYSGPVAITYSITEPEQDYAAMDVMYSIDGGSTFTPATVSGLGLVFNPGNYNGTFQWHTETDLPGVFKRVLFVASPYDADPGVPDSLLIWVDNYGACRAVVTMPGGEQTGDVTVQYSITDPKSRTVSLSAEYSTDGGSSWHPAAFEGGQNLTPAGYTGQATWRSSSALAGFEGTALLKLIPDNGIEGIYSIGSVALDYNAAPSLTANAASEELSGDTGFICRVTDEEHDSVTIELEFSIDGGNTWYEATVSGNTGIPGDGASHTVTWQSMTDLPNRETRNLMVRLRPSDADPGGWISLGPLHLDNNLPPTISISMDYPDSIRTEYAVISYHIEDAERNMVSLLASFSTNGGQTFKPATVTGNVTGIFSSAYDGSLRWELDDDIAAGAGTAVFKLAVADEDTGTADSITVQYNTYGISEIVLMPPQSEQEGDVPIQYEIIDPKGNTVDLTVEFSINKFGFWQAATVTGALTGIGPAGYSGSFTWIASQDIAGFQGKAKLRVTPDNGGAGTPVVIEFAVDNNEPPAIVSVILDTEREYAGNVLISYRGSDGENDPLTVSLAYSLDDGETFNPATSAGGAAVRPGVNGLITWLSNADLGFVWRKSVTLALIPSDGDPGASFEVGPITVTNMAGDFNYDLRIDGSDLPIFTDAWKKQDLTRELGPVAGTPPEIVPEPDGRVDFEDLAVFVWMWNWYSGQAVEEAVNDNTITTKHAANEYETVKITPIGNGLLHVEAEKPLDFIRIITSPETGALISLTDAGYWNESGEGIILSREYHDGSSELAAARFGKKMWPQTESFGSICIEGVAGDVSLTLLWRVQGESTIYSRSITVAYEDLTIMPKAYNLGVNTPNPFNPATTITYSLPTDTHVRLTIFNSTGQVVAELCDKGMSAGVHTMVWDASGMPSGVYFYRLHAGEFVKTRKMLLLK